MGDSELHRVLDILPDLVARFDREGRFTYINAAALRAFGAPSEHLLGRTPVEIPGFEASGQELHASILTAAAQRKPRVLEVELETVDGRRAFEILHAPDLDASGEVSSVIGIARDITRLQESEREARTLADHSPDLIARFDPQGRYAYVNRTLAEVTGIPAPAYRGRHIGELLGTGAAAAGFAVLRERVAQAIATRAPSEIEIELAVGGKPLLFEIRLIPELAEGGALASVLAIGRDITARRALEEQLVRAQKMEAVGQVAGAIAHDFNNMLNVMQMHASIALRAADLESAWARVREILAATERASRLTRELLAFSSRRSASLVDVDLGAVVVNLATLLGGSLGPAVALETRIAPALPPVRADAGMIEQALTNLAINARDAMPEGGVVEISLDDVTTSARPGRHVCMTVRDSGCGIAPEVQARIFEPYFTTKPVGKGTGLGLATVFGIVQQHDGWIEVDSVVDRGTAVRLYFPVT